MRLTIDVNEEDYKALHECVTILNGRRNGKTLESRIFAAVGNGTPIKKGEWKHKIIKGEFDDYNEYTCPFCGFTNRKSAVYTFMFKFCPICGADMRKEESALRKRAEMEMVESCYLEQGITQGIV